jgi:hypothetical protein
MKFKTSFLISALLVIAAILHAQTPVDGIIASYFDAIGGHDKIAQINSVYMEASMDVMGNSSPAKITILNGKGYKNEMNFGGSDIVQTVTDTGGWMINPFMGSPEAAPLPNDQYVAMKNQIYIGGPLFNYANNGYAVKFLGMDAVDGKSAYKIEAVSPDSIRNTFYIDSATHYLDQLVVDAGGQTTTAKYSNFQKTDFGNVMAYSEELTTQGYQVNITVNHVEINKPVDPTIFDMPKKP